MPDHNGTRRHFLKHQAEPGTYAIEIDEDGQILAALDVTDEATKGGLCTHLLSSLPLAGRIDDVDYLNRQRECYEVFEPECGNVHHLMADLIELERAHRRLIDRFAFEDSTAKSTKKDMEAAGAKVHALLARIADRKPLPLFDAAGV